MISDRFVDSSRVYQGTLGRVDPKLLRALERVTISLSSGNNPRLICEAYFAIMDQARQRGIAVDGHVPGWVVSPGAVSEVQACVSAAAIHSLVCPGSADAGRLT